MSVIASGYQFPHVERKSWTKQITSGATATQISVIAWTTPASACAWLEKLAISNQNAGAAVVTMWDADITTATGTKPPARGSNAAPLIPPINVAAGAQVFLGADLCPNIELIGGITAQSTVNAVYVFVQYLEQLG